VKSAVLVGVAGLVVLGAAALVVSGWWFAGAAALLAGFVVVGLLCQHPSFRDTPVARRLSVRRVEPKALGAIVVNGILVALAAGLGFACYWLLRNSPVPVNNWIVGAVAAAAMAAVAVTILGMGRARKQNLVVLIVSVTVAAAAGNYALELTGRDLVTIVDRHVVRALVADRAVAQPIAAPSSPLDTSDLPPRPIDNRSHDEIKSALRASGVETYRLVSPHFLLDLVDKGEIDILPVSGIANVTTVHCNEGDQVQQPIIRTDRYGYNNEDTVYDWNTDRILVLGDSYVYGFCVHQEQTVAGVLRRNGFAAVSAGVGGSGPLTNLAALREYGPLLKPRAVAWFHYERNDFPDFRDRELRSPFLTQYFNSQFSQGLAVRQGEVDALWKHIFTHDPMWQETVGDYYAGVKAFVDGGRPTDPERLAYIQSVLGVTAFKTLTSDRDIIVLFLEMMKMAKQQVESWGGTFHFVPVRSVLNYRGTWSETHLDRVLAGVRDLGIPIVDIDAKMRATGDPGQFFPRNHGEPHYNAKGYALFAYEILRAIGRNQE